MIIQNDPPVHLTYCLNVHRGESWAENFAAIRKHALAVRARVAPGARFGLGLRLSHQAARTLASTALRDELKQFLAEQNLYVFTINGFPFGRFHAGRVKEQVYAPDWQTPERRDYTNLLADILADLLPEDVAGSISTVPGSFKPWITHENHVREMVRRLAESVAHLAQIERDCGKEIHLGLEPEPACFLETTDEAVAFFHGPMRREGIGFLQTLMNCDTTAAEKLLRRHLGICFDTCHVALQFEDLVESLNRFAAEGVRLSKIQLSAALRATPQAASWRALEPFCEPVYLHQTKAQRGSSGDLLSWTDLPEALRELPELADLREARVHFHVPLFCEHYGALQSTASLLTPDFFTRIGDGRSPHWEIETYTFDVLPPDLRADGVVASIAREFAFVQERAALNRPAPAA